MEGGLTVAPHKGFGSEKGRGHLMSALRVRAGSKREEDMSQDLRVSPRWLRTVVTLTFFIDSLSPWRTH